MTPPKKAEPKEVKLVEADVKYVRSADFADFSVGARVDKLEAEVAHLKQVIANNLGIAV